MKDAGKEPFPKSPGRSPESHIKEELLAKYWTNIEFSPYCIQAECGKSFKDDRGVWKNSTM